MAKGVLARDEGPKEVNTHKRGGVNKQKQAGRHEGECCVWRVRPKHKQYRGNAPVGVRAFGYLPPCRWAWWEVLAEAGTEASAVGSALEYAGIRWEKVPLGNYNEKHQKG